MVEEILGCLPNSKWGPKVITIEEAQDLKMVTLRPTREVFYTQNSSYRRWWRGFNIEGRALKTTNEDFYSLEEKWWRWATHNHDCLQIEQYVQVKEIQPQKNLQKRFKKDERTSKDRNFSNYDESNTVFLFVVDCRATLWKIVQSSKRRSKNKSKKPKEEFKKAIVAHGGLRHK